MRYPDFVEKDMTQVLMQCFIGVYKDSNMNLTRKEAKKDLSGVFWSSFEDPSTDYAWQLYQMGAYTTMNMADKRFAFVLDYMNEPTFWQKMKNSWEFFKRKF